MPRRTILYGRAGMERALSVEASCVGATSFDAAPFQNG